VEFLGKENQQNKECGNKVKTTIQYKRIKENTWALKEMVYMVFGK